VFRQLSRFAADLLVWESGGSSYMVGVPCEELRSSKDMQGTAEEARKWCAYGRIIRTIPEGVPHTA
jgi:hypothetical protein